ncbi:glycosyl transferase, partial [Streptococcus pneumoniae]
MKNILKKLIQQLPDKLFLQIKYFYIFKKKLNLKNPKTFNEKLQWLKLYDRNPFYTILADKILVKDYIAKTLGEEYVIPTLGVYHHFDEIDF